MKDLSRLPMLLRFPFPERYSKFAAELGTVSAISVSLLLRYQSFSQHVNLNIDGSRRCELMVIILLERA